MRLYRGIGPAELEAIFQSDFRRFPALQESQKFFRASCTPEYAIETAREWCVKNFDCGYVVAFEVPDDYLERFDANRVGFPVHDEYQIPAAKFERFNSEIIGAIEVLYTFPEKHTETTNGISGSSQASS